VEDGQPRQGRRDVFSVAGPSFNARELHLLMSELAAAWVNKVYYCGDELCDDKCLLILWLTVEV
jgi:hypothetical protein